ncbi:MAG: nucleotide exchange factor GrpE [Patescibacteria group bacterium]
MSDDKIKKLEEELAAIKAQAKEYLDGWKRARADYLNREKEIEKEKIAWIKFANLELILNLLLILDSFEQSVKQISEELKDNEWVKGILKIKEQFENFLKLQGVERIKTIGEKFNPDFHEVIEKRGGEGIIVEEIQAGYTMHGQVIRTAKVVIE